MYIHVTGVWSIRSQTAHLPWWPRPGFVYLWCYFEISKRSHACCQQKWQSLKSCRWPVQEPSRANKSQVDYPRFCDCCRASEKWELSSWNEILQHALCLVMLLTPWRELWVLPSLPPLCFSPSTWGLETVRGRSSGSLTCHGKNCSI